MTHLQSWPALAGHPPCAPQRQLNRRNRRTPTKGSSTSPVYEGTQLELLALRECWRLLDEHRLGRVGLVVNREPVILLVNYAVHERSIVFRTAGGTKLAPVITGGAVAFEVDGTDGEGTGWSVLATGRAERITDPRMVGAVERLGLRSWAPGAKLYWVRIVPWRVTGRRLPAPDTSRR